MMLNLAKDYPEYADGLAKVKVVETTSGEYYGKGYQDVQNRVPKIANTQRDLAWEPTITMADALKGIFDYYRSQMANAKDLVN